MGNLAGKIALVTGASAGIGAATARRLASDGARVAVVARRDKESKEVVESIVEAGGEACFVRTDITDPAQVRAMVDTVVGWGGGLDIAVNNAGIGGTPGPLADVALTDWTAVLSTNLSGLFHCMQAEIRAMRASGGGSIVNVLSAAARRPFRGIGPYVASKYGGLGLTQTAALEEIGNGIRVNAVCCGGTRTDLAMSLERENPQMYATLSATMPIGRLATPQEQAAVIAFLCGPDASFITAADLPVDGGQLTS